MTELTNKVLNFKVIFFKKRAGFMEIKLVCRNTNFINEEIEKFY